MSCSACTRSASRRCARPGRSSSGREISVRAPRARRSELATPASSQRMCEKAPETGADLVFLDLEDACAPSAKESARGIAVGA
ncbi:MAG TPA: aldolase/citrate lyase family protein, partial [Acidimicrobiales bacterium]|nr:aldolase/citrate lyase family protein [Acidimicrobiales bacterium]